MIINDNALEKYCKEIRDEARVNAVETIKKMHDSIERSKSTNKAETFKNQQLIFILNFSLLYCMQLNNYLKNNENFNSLKVDNPKYLLNEIEDCIDAGEQFSCKVLEYLGNRDEEEFDCNFKKFYDVINIFSKDFDEFFKTTTLLPKSESEKSSLRLFTKQNKIFSWIEMPLIIVIGFISTMMFFDKFKKRYFPYHLLFGKLQLLVYIIGKILPLIKCDNYEIKLLNEIFEEYAAIFIPGVYIKFDEEIKDFNKKLEYILKKLSE